jgi:hypothetical protein
VLLAVFREGSGADLVVAIRDAPRALVFISVPWSCPERNARQVFRAAVAKLEAEFPDLGTNYFRLDVDEDEISQKWLLSVGCPQFARLGAGSLLWLESGQVIFNEISANSLGVKGIVSRSKALWGTRTDANPDGRGA